MRTTTLGNGFALFGLFGLLAAQAPAAEFVLDDAMRARIDAEAQRLVDQQRAPGLAIGVMHDGKLVYARGFGSSNLETQAPVTPDSVFMIGSITKQFTAASVVLLAEQGKLKVDDPLSLYLPDFPRGKDVTLRQLMTHTAGIHPIMGGGGPSPTPQQMAAMHTTADMVAFIAALPDLYDFEPGTSFQYSNSGYWLLGAVVEKVSGMSLADFLKRNIFDRAGMTASAMDSERAIVPHRADGYLRSPDGGAYVNAGPGFIKVNGGAGGIHSNVGDMLRWQDALLDGRIVSPEGLKMMTTPRTLKDGQPVLEGGPDGPRSYGLGLGLGDDNGHRYYSHTGGSSEGFTAVLKMYPEERVAFVVLTNMGVGGGMRQRLPQPAEPLPEAAKKAGKGKKKTGVGPDGQLGASLEMSQFLSTLISTNLPRQEQAK